MKSAKQVMDPKLEQTNGIIQLFILQKRYIKYARIRIEIKSQTNLKIVEFLVRKTRNYFKSGYIIVELI